MHRYADQSQPWMRRQERTRQFFREPFGKPELAPLGDVPSLPFHDPIIHRITRVIAASGLAQVQIKPYINKNLLPLAAFPIRNAQAYPTLDAVKPNIVPHSRYYTIGCWPFARPSSDANSDML